jgi:hypothetical protein
MLLMRNFKSSDVVLLGAVFMVMFSALAMPASAANEKHAKAGATSAKSTVTKKSTPTRDIILTVNNQRKSAVVFFTTYGKESSGQEPNLLKDALAAGKSIKVKVKSVSGCLLSVAADFEDGSSVEASGLDVCKDPVVKLVD